jgi:ribosomal protein S27E
MSNQAENKPEAKGGHKLQGKYHLNFRLDPEDFAVIEQHQKEFGFKNCVSAIRDILQKVRSRGLQSEEKILEFQTCKCRDEIPTQYGKFVRCKMEKRRVTEIYCTNCQYSKINKVRLMTIKQLEQCIKNLLIQKQTLTAEVQELEPNARVELLKKIEWLEVRLKIMVKLLEEKNIYLKNADGKMWEKDQCIKYLESSIEPYNNLHKIEATVKDKEPLQTSQQIPEKSVESQLVKRVIKKETKEETTETFKQPQEPKTPSEDLQIECPNTGKKVIFKDACHTCPTFLTCPSYGEAVMMNKVLRRQ